jgi:hypothetical protein
MKTIVAVAFLAVLTACSSVPADPCNDPSIFCKFKTEGYKPLQADHAVVTDDGKVYLKANWKSVRDAELEAPLRRRYGTMGQ